MLKEHDGAHSSTLDPGGSTYPDNSHEGEEFGYSISGSIIPILAIEASSQKGESLFYS